MTATLPGLDSFCENYWVTRYEFQQFDIHIVTLSYAMHGESIVIGLAASSTSKGPQVKTAEPMVLIKVTYCSIQLG